MNKSNHSKLNILFYSVIIVFLLLFQICMMHSSRQNIVLKDHWNALSGGYSVNDAEFSELNYPVKKDQMITLSTRLPEQKIAAPMIKLWIYQSVFKVYVDGKPVYESGEKEHAKGCMPANGIFLIPLPAGSEGKTLTIEIVPIENNAFRNLTNIELQSEHTIIENYIQYKLFYIVVADFLLIFGAILFFAHMLMPLAKDVKGEIWFSIIFTLLGGTWIILNNSLYRLAFEKIPFSTEAEYFCVYIFPIVLLFFLNKVPFCGQTKKVARVAYISSIIMFALIWLAYLLKLITLSKLLVPYLIINISLLIIVFFIIKKNVDEEQLQPRERLMRVISAICMLLIADSVVYHFLRKFMIWKEQDLIAPIVAILLIIALIQNIFESVMAAKSIQIQNAALEKLAYTDQLTGLHNRTYCVKCLDEGRAKSAVINFDLNNLKTVNDTRGHACGDQYIKGFADCIQTVFSEAVCVGRMGGDEFLVLLEGVDIVTVQKMMKKLEECVKDYNKRNPDHQSISYAHGFALKVDRSKSSWGIYEEADKNMYSMKKYMKEKDK